MAILKILRLQMQSAGGIFSTYIASSPLWLKLIIGGSLLLYIYIQRKWTALNDCGVDVLTPKERISVREFASTNYFFKFWMRIYQNSKQKIWTLGTMGQYFVTGRYADWAKEELLDKNRRSVAFYRGITPTILTGNDLKNLLTPYWFWTPCPFESG